jgi:hypothetical protein
MKLNQISAGDELTQLVVKKMTERANVLLFAEFYSIFGNAEYARKTATASGGRFRALDADYDGNVITPTFASPALKILGDHIQVDQAHERRGYDIGSVRASELLNFAANLGRQFQNYFFNGSTASSSEEFDGIKRLVPAFQKITAATNGLSIDLGNSDAAKGRQQKFLELLDTLIGSIDGGAQVVFMDSKTLARLTTIAREFITTQVNQFGQPIKYFNDIPVLPSGYDNSGSRVIAHDEVTGSASNCTSIYAVRFGERSDISVATNCGVDVKDLGLVGSFYTHKAELDAAPVVLNDKAVARLEGIIIS